MNEVGKAMKNELRSRLGARLRTTLVRRDPGQATTEYALVLVGAAVVALLVVAWATEGGGAGRIGELFDTVLSGVLDRANSVPIDSE
jgi:hypothetical protein